MGRASTRRTNGDTAENGSSECASRVGAVVARSTGWLLVNSKGLTWKRSHFGRHAPRAGYRRHVGIILNIWQFRQAKGTVKICSRQQKFFPFSVRSCRLFALVRVYRTKRHTFTKLPNIARRFSM